jgi:hypothetical protein
VKSKELKWVQGPEENEGCRDGRGVGDGFKLVVASES